jgi:hypothetical protein
VLVGSRSTSAVLAHNIRMTGSNTVNTEMPKPGISRGTLPSNCAATGLSGGSAMRGAIHDAKMGPASDAVGSPTRMA